MSTLPRNFQRLHLALAREPGHPAGDIRHGYEIVAPLTEDGHFDAVAWHAHRDACRVQRFRPGEDDAHGLLARKPGGQWYFAYGDDGGEESCFRRGDERFAPGEYVSIRENDGDLHTFKVVSASPV